MKKLLILFFLFSSVLVALEKRTVCLNMIVKDESDVIERCLNSVKPLIDYWVIVDTGSTDGTQEIIKNCMKGIPGMLYERSWVNFAHNRNEALQLARDCADYLLFIDADEELIYEDGFTMPHLDKDLYHLTVDYSGINYVRHQVVKAALDWRWVGVLHETLVCNQVHSQEKLKGIRNFVRTDGCRSKDPNKFMKDAAILEAALREEPENSRYQFYLAQSYRDGGDYEKAIENYQKRVEMGGWTEEVFWSMYQIGILKEALKKPPEEIIQAYSEAYAHLPSRAESLCRLASYLRNQGQYLLAYLVASQGLSIKEPEPSIALFVEKWVYRYFLKLEKAISAYWIGRFQECLLLSHEVLMQGDLPEDIQECAENTKQWAIRRLSSQPHHELMQKLWRVQ